jgi:hypothetical protein
VGIGITLPPQSAGVGGCVKSKSIKKGDGCNVNVLSSSGSWSVHPHDVTANACKNGQVCCNDSRINPSICDWNSEHRIAKLLSTITSPSLNIIIHAYRWHHHSIRNDNKFEEDKNETRRYKRRVCETD